MYRLLFVSHLNIPICPFFFFFLTFNSILIEFSPSEIFSAVSGDFILFFLSYYRQCLCCFKEYKHLEIFNQVVCALINLVIAEVQALRDQLCKHCTINIDSTWQDHSNCADEPLNVERDSHDEEDRERQRSIEKKIDSARTCILTEESSTKSIDGFSWSTDEKEKLLLCVAKIFQIQFPLYTAYKHNTHPTIEVCFILICVFNYLVTECVFLPVCVPIATFAQDEQIQVSCLLQ